MFVFTPTGFLRAKLTFNTAPKRDLVLMMIAETSELMTIDGNDNVQMSYRDMVRTHQKN